MNPYEHSCDHGHHATHAHDHAPLHPAKPATETPTPAPGTIYIISL